MSYKVNANLAKKVIATEMVQEAIAADVIEKFAGSVEMLAGKPTVPMSAAVAKIRDSSSTSYILPGTRPLVGSGVVGRQSAKGNEEELRTMDMQLTANSWGHAVPTEKYGIDFVRQSHLDIYKAARPELQRWYSQMRGWKLRQALIEQFSIEQTAAPTSKSLNLNRNWLMFDTTSSVKVATYSSTLATFRSNINTAIGAAGANVKTPTMDALLALQEIITTTLNIEPLVIGGKETYIVLVPSATFRKLVSPAASGSFGDYAKYDKADFGLGGVVEFLNYGPMLIIPDNRAVAFGNNAGSLTFGYMGPGATRNISVTGDPYQLGIVLGKGALYEYEQEALHWEEDVDNYGRDKGIGMFTTASWTLGQWYDSVDTTQVINKSSAVLVLPNAG